MSAHIFGYAPGKLILLGEHAVVYGMPAIAATIDRGVRVVISEREKRDGPVLRGNVRGLGAVRARPAREGEAGEGPEALRKALVCLCDIFGESVRGLTFVIESAIPSGCGLGSSAAIAVALVRGVQRYLNEDASVDVTIARAHRLESVFHGTPSGVDHTTIAHGGLLYFQRELAEATDAAVPYTCANIEPKRSMRLVVAISGPHAGTAQAVKALSDRSKRHPKAYRHIYEQIGDLARSARECIELGKLAALGELWDLNQGLLNALGVSTPKIELLCHTARQHGALGAKITGAGCGGAIIALVDDDTTEMVKALENAGATVFETSIGAKLEESHINCAQQEMAI